MASLNITQPLMSVMVKENGNDEKTLEVELPAKTVDRLESYSEDTGKSVRSIVRDSVDNYIDKCEVRSVISDACEKGTIRSESKACRYLEEHPDHN